MLNTIAQNNTLVSLEWVLSLSSTSPRAKGWVLPWEGTEEWRAQICLPRSNYGGQCCYLSPFVSLMTYQKISSNDIRLSESPVAKLSSDALLIIGDLVTQRESTKALNLILMWKVILCLEATDTAFSGLDETQVTLLNNILSSKKAWK